MPSTQGCTFNPFGVERVIGAPRTDFGDEILRAAERGHGAVAPQEQGLFEAL